MKEASVKDISKDQFLAFEGVRRYGRWNMFDPMAKKASGLDDDTYFGIILHYTELKEKYVNRLDDAWKETEKIMINHEKEEK
jgi:hypothetical protein